MYNDETLSCDIEDDYEDQQYVAKREIRSSLKPKHLTFFAKN